MSADDWKANGAADAVAEDAFVSSEEARRRARRREAIAQWESADYWHGYADKAAEIEEARS